MFFSHFMITTYPLIDIINKNMPEIAKKIVLVESKLPEKEKQEFLKDIDSYYEHEPKWHQWGIITHSRKCSEEYEKYVSENLNGSKLLGEFKKQEIEGMPKYQLLRVLAPLHDIGKLLKGPKDKNGRFQFGEHEKESKRIIISDYIYPLLRENGLKKSQIKYIADVAENHGFLGEIRQKLKKSDKGYCFDNLNNGDLEEILTSKVSLSDKFNIEKGIFFVVDSLAKTEFQIKANSDSEVKEKIPEINKNLKEKNLSPDFIEAVLQQPINLHLAEKYIKYLERNYNQ